MASNGYGCMRQYMYSLALLARMKAAVYYLNSPNDCMPKDLAARLSLRYEVYATRSGSLSATKFDRSIAWLRKTYMTTLLERLGRHYSMLRSPISSSRQAIRRTKHYGLRALADAWKTFSEAFRDDRML